MIRLSQPPRRYLPEGLSPADPAAATERFDELERRPLPDAAALRRWLADLDELATAIEQERNLRYIATTQHTDDEAIQAAYRGFVETMDPLVKERMFRLEGRLVASPFIRELDPEQYGEYLKAVAQRQRLFRKENVPLEVEISNLETEYGKLIGATLVEFEGKRLPLPRMRVYRDDLDRSRREAAWRATTERVLRDREAYEALFEKLFALRQQVARNAGFRDFVGYRFAEWRRPYTPDDCRRFHDAVEKRVSPLLGEIRRQRRDALGLDALRPWDLEVDVKGRPALRPFRDGAELTELARDLLGRVDPEFGRRIDWMASNRMLDLESRPGKGPGGYMCELPERRVPFIFMNAAGLQADVKTMLHEGGHAFHVFETRHLEPSFNRNAPIEFAEVASMSMELLGLDFAEARYGSADAQRARREHLEGIVWILTWVATIDSFQLALYERPGHTRDERRRIWLDCSRRFRSEIDFRGLEEAEASRWHQQSHIFVHPLYYIEYAIAQLGALQVWRNFRRDPAAGVRAYRSGLALGGTRPLPQLFEAAGARWDFGENVVGALMDFVADELAKHS
jgi:oligoendopeptidase F